MTGVLRSDTGHETAPLDDPGETPTPADIAALIVELQSAGLRTDADVETRTGGAGPSDSGMLWIEGMPVTVPVRTEEARRSPYVLRPEDDGGRAIYRDGRRLASVAASHRPRYYDRETADGVPYWKIALLHLDSMASTVVQTCNYWNTADQCRFCGIGVSLAAGSTIVKKTPEQLAEVSVAAKELDGAVDATLTTGSSTAPDRGARYVARCGRAVKDASGLPVEIQFEPPRDLAILDEVHDMGGSDAVGIHVESFDPAGAGPRRAGQGAHRDRDLLPDVGARGRAVGLGARVDLRHPRHGRGPRPDRRGLPARGGHRRLPVHRPAAPRRGEPDGGLGAAARRVQQPDLLAGRRVHEPSGA